MATREKWSSADDLVTQSKTIRRIQNPNNQANAAYSPIQVQRHGICVMKMSDAMDRSQDGSPAFVRQSIQPADPYRYGRVYISASGIACSSKASIATPQVQVAFQDTE
jgi:hypothetical protein